MNYYSFTGGMEGWVGPAGWLIADILPTVDRAQVRGSRWPKTDVVITELRCQR